MTCFLGTLKLTQITILFIVWTACIVLERINKKTNSFFTWHKYSSLNFCWISCKHLLQLWSYINTSSHPHYIFDLLMDDEAQSQQNKIRPPTICKIFPNFVKVEEIITFKKVFQKKKQFVTCQKKSSVTFVIENTKGAARHWTFTKCLHKKVPINKRAMTSQPSESFSIFSHSDGRHTLMHSQQLPHCWPKK